MNKDINNRTNEIKSYLKRLGEGEDLESVKADFAKNFSHVDASEIMQAEQDLMNEGVPLEEVQKLCDVHSALFHGATKAEMIEKNRKNNMKMAKKELADELIAISGHPLQTLTKENENMGKLILTVREKLENDENIDELLEKIREISIHYAKKGDLLYPLLDVKYGISGPSNVMWTVDDEIRSEFTRLSKNIKHDNSWKIDVFVVLKRAEEMIYKETNILFPICAMNFSEEEWHGIYRDAKDYDNCLGVEIMKWEEAEEDINIEQQAMGNEIVMPGGHLTVEQLTALLNTIPLEITFVDAENINRYFNEGPKAFKRPTMAIDREVFSCHPPKVEPMVRKIIDDFRNNRKDSLPIWMEKAGKTFLVTYMAVRDKENKYLGTAEIVQDMEFAKKHFK